MITKEVHEVNQKLNELLSKYQELVDKIESLEKVIRKSFKEKIENKAIKIE